MPKPYDATIRDLFGQEPAAWSEFLGFPVPDPGLVEVLESNLSTFTADADKVLRIGGVDPLILHIEFLSGRDLGYPAQALWYNTLIHRKYRLPVWTVLFLLRPAADGPELTGEYEQEVPGRGRNLSFRYDVVRLWKLPPDRLLTGGLALLPLVSVSDVAPERLPEALTAVAKRLRDEATPELTKTLWTATSIFSGLRYRREQVAGLIEGVANMMLLNTKAIRASWVWQDIFAEGGLEEARKILLRQGRKRLGEPDERSLAEIEAVAEVERLEALLDRILDASSWDELLPPRPPVATADQETR